MTDSTPDLQRRAATVRPLPLAISRVLWPTVALFALLLFDAAFTKNFFHLTLRDGRLYGSLIDVLTNGSPIILLALGQALVIATGGVDLSVGAVMAISGATAACLLSRPPGSPLSAFDMHGAAGPAVAIALVVATVAGAWNGLLVAGLRLQPIIATLVLMVAGRGLAQLLTDGQIISVHDARFDWLAGGAICAVPARIVLALVTAVVVGLFVRTTALGLFLESVGNNPRAARMAGVSTRIVTGLAYTVSGICAGLAGLVATADIHAADANQVGLNSELDAILAVSLGGTALAGGRFSLVGSVIGALLIQTLTTTILLRGVPPAVTLVVKGCVVAVVCLLQSEGARAALRQAVRRSPRPEQTAATAAQRNVA